MNHNREIEIKSILTYFVIMFIWTGGLSAETNISSSNLVAKGDAPLREQLRTTYSKYYEAMKTGDVSLWQKYSSTFSVLEGKNLIMSTGHILDGELLKGASSMMMPLDGLEELAVRQNKDTAKLVLFGRPKGAKDSGNMHIVPSFHTIDFICEKGTWKVQEVGGKMPSQIPGAEEAIAKGDYSSILTNDFFNPNGAVPTMPKEVKAIDVQGMLSVQSGGYDTEIWINGYKQSPRDPIIDTSMGGPVIGGLKFGTNVIKLVVEKINKPSGYDYNILKYEVVVGRRNENFDQVFAYNPTNDPVSHEATFVVEKEVVNAALGKNAIRLPKQAELLDKCHQLYPDLIFKKRGSGFNEMLLADSVTGRVQRTINILPHPVAGEPVQGVNVILSTLPDIEIESVQDEVARSMQKYMTDFVAKFAPETSCHVLGKIIAQMTGKGEGKPAKHEEKDGNLLFSLKKDIRDANGKQTLTWTLSITDLQAYNESVAKELKERK